VPRRLAHQAKVGEVACLTLGPLILLGVGGVIVGEVEVAEGYTRSGIIFWNFFFLSLKQYFLPSSLSLE
jgi:hypothetical protein